MSGYIGIIFRTCRNSCALLVSIVNLNSTVLPKYAPRPIIMNSRLTLVGILSSPVCSLINKKYMPAEIIPTAM